MRQDVSGEELATGSRTSSPIFGESSLTGCESRSVFGAIAEPTAAITERAVAIAGTALARLLAEGTSTYVRGSRSLRRRR